MTTTAHTPVVCAVVVIYRPETAVLRELLAAVGPQVAATVVVDNGSDRSDTGLAELLQQPAVTMLRNDSNHGLAKALNQGIAWARQQHATHVLLLDQDSTPAPDMVARLLAALARLEADGPVGAVGPTLIDPRTGRRAHFVRFGFPLNPLVHAAPDEIVRCDFLTTSGSLIPMTVLDRFGGMEEPFFIDHIDVEWCARVRQGGFRIHGVGSATMLHRIGDRLLMGTRLFVHSPERLYYIMRNRVLLYRLPHIPWAWIGQDLLRIPIKFALFSLFVPGRLRNIGGMLAGLRDGVLGRNGPRAT